MSFYLVGSFDGLRSPAPICKWIKPCDRSETDEELQSIWSCIPVKDLMTERNLLESPSGKTVFVLKLNPHDASYIKSKIPQEPFEFCIKLIEIWTGKIIGVQDVMQELKVIVEEFEVPRAPLEGMPMLSYPKPLQECIKESQQRFNKVVWGRKWKFTSIKPEGDLERWKKIKTNTDKMA